MIDIGRHGDCAVLKFNRPDALNALNADGLITLEEALKELATSDARALILTGAGDRAYCAGADINELGPRTPGQVRAAARRGQAIGLQIEILPFPSIAVINGYALGGGLELYLACTFRLAARTAMMGFPEVKLGICTGWGGTQRLPRIVGIGLANELIATGRRISAQEAKDIGLVNHVVEQDKLIQKCKDISIEILKNGPNAIAKSLQCIRYGIGRNLDEGLKFEVKAFSSLFDKPESKEGLIAFVEKRKAKFR